MKRRKPDENAGDIDATNKTLQAAERNNDIQSTRHNTNLFGYFISFLKYCVIIVLLPPFLNFAALHQEKRHLIPQAGELYDVGFGQMMYFACYGSGTPAILLDAPTGMSSDVWMLVVQQLSTTTRVCVYDRAGLGFSDRPYRNASVNDETKKNDKSHNRWQEYTVERMADDVYRLVTYRSQQLEKPFIYVGSELGALVARFYTNIYEGDVAAVLLIEPLVETLFAEDAGIWAQHWFSHVLPGYQTMQLTAATGISRMALMAGLLDTPIAQSEQGFPHDVLARQKYLLCQPRHLSTAVDEHHFINESFSQIQTLSMMKQFPSNVSVTVMNGNYYDEQLPSALNKAWAKAQQHLISRLHPNAHHVVVNGADRKMLYRNPEAIVEQIKKLVKHRQTQMKKKTLVNSEKS